MQRIEKLRDRDGAQGAVMDLQVSTAAELPGAEDAVQGLTVLPGSIAQVIQTGTFYTMDEDGTWYDSGGNANG